MKDIKKITKDQPAGWLLAAQYLVCALFAKSTRFMDKILNRYEKSMQEAED